jgi:hypothetical protein
LGNSLQQLWKGLRFSVTSIPIDSDNMQMAFAIHSIGACRRSSSHSSVRADCFFKPQRRALMALKPGPKPTAKSTGKPDQRRRDNKTTPGNTPSLKPSKSSNPPKSK